MVPVDEFEALKALTAKIESDLTEKCTQKDNYIQSLKGEIERMQGEFSLDFEEFKLQHELKTQDLEQRVKLQQQRLDMFERNAEFDEILKTYNNQMQQMESDNILLLAEIRRIIKVDS